MNPQKWIFAFIAGGAGMLASAQSPLFEGGNPEAWVLELDKPSLQSIDTGQWLDTFGDSGISLSGKQQALINNLANSMPPMQPMQAAVSLAGLAQASNSQQNPQNDQVLRVWPNSGAYDRTIRLELGVSPELLASSQSLGINAFIDGRPFISVVLCAQHSPPGCQTGASVRDGYVGVVDHLIETGTSNLTVELRNASNQQLAVLTKRYEIAVDDVQGRRRDSDGDGIPDLVERELGLDPLGGDRDHDSDGDGWSDFDEWLRGADEAKRNDPNWVPVDTDGDGWSDWDEQLRGTRVDDPDPKLLARAGENTQTDAVSGDVLLSESYKNRAQRFREFPRARRLYEVEYLADGASLSARAGVNGKWQQASAQTLGGHKVWRQLELVDQALLDVSALDASDLAPSRLASQAQAALSAGRFPVARFPAADGVMVDVALTLAEGTALMHKRYLPAVVDADLARFNSGQPQWADAEGFRTAYTNWLRVELVQPWNDAVDWSATRTALALELLLSDEARLNAAAAPLVFNDRVDPVARLWLGDFLKQLDTIAPAGGLNALAMRLDSVLSGAGILRDVADFMDEQLAPQQLPVGALSDVYMAERFVSSFVLQDEDCFVSAEFLDLIEQSASAQQQFNQRCPMYATEVEAQQVADQDRARRYALRSLLLLEPAQLAADQSLLDPDADSDGDGRNNDQEVRAVLLAQSSQPDLADSDGDGNPDDTDLCPRDLTDECLGLPSRPRLLSDMEPLAEEGEGALAVVVLHLDRPVSFPIVGAYRTQSVDGDSATADVDYSRTSGRFVFNPGQQVVNITIPIIADSLDEGIETFTLLIEDIVDAISTIPANQIEVSIADPDLGGPPQDPPQAVASGPVSVDENAQVSLDGRASSDPLGQGLSYTWVQKAGPAVTLNGASSAQASFTAPSVASSQTLTIQLTVSDAESRSDSALIHIQVQPVNDPPEVLGTAKFRVERGSTLNVQEHELLAYVSDPDGDLTYLDEFTSEPLGGRFSGASTGFEFTAYQGESILSADVDDAQLQQAGVEHAVWLEDLAGEKALKVYSLSDASVRTQWQSEDLLDVVAGSGIAVAYTRSSSLTEGETWALEWISHGDRVELGSLAIYHPDSVIIDPQLGDLYYCDSSTLVWSYVDAQTGQVQASTTSCSGSYHSGPKPLVRRGAELCFGEESRLYCARGNQVRQVVDLMDHWEGVVWATFQVYAVGDELLVPVAQGYPGTDIELLRIDAQDQISRLAVLPDAGDYIQSAGSSQFGGLMLGTRTSAGMRMYYWPGGAAPPREVTGPFGNLTSNWGWGTLVEYGDKAYWYIELQGDDTALFEIDLAYALATGELVKPHSVFDGESGTGLSYRLKTDAQGVLALASAGPHQCRLIRIRPGAGVVEDIATELDCGAEVLLMRDGFVYQREAVAPNYVAPVCYTDGAALIGTTDFSAAILDTQGNRAELPIQITIEDTP